MYWVGLYSEARSVRVRLWTSWYLSEPECLLPNYLVEPTFDKNQRRFSSLRCLYLSALKHTNSVSPGHVVLRSPHLETNSSVLFSFTERETSHRRPPWQLLHRSENPPRPLLVRSGPAVSGSTGLTAELHDSTAKHQLYLNTFKLLNI